MGSLQTERMRGEEGKERKRVVWCGEQRPSPSFSLPPHFKPPPPSARTVELHAWLLLVSLAFLPILTKAWERTKADSRACHSHRPRSRKSVCVCFSLCVEYAYESILYVNAFEHMYMYSICMSMCNMLICLCTPACRTIWENIHYLFHEKEKIINHNSSDLNQNSNKKCT